MCNLEYWGRREKISNMLQAYTKKNIPNHSQSLPQNMQQSFKIILKSSPNHPQIIPKSCPKRPGIDLESTQNQTGIDLESTLDRPRIDPGSNQNQPQTKPG